MSVSPDGYSLGWDPELEVAARESWAKAGQPFAFGAAPLLEDTRPFPEGFSLSQFVRYYFNQGPVGSCAPNSGCQVVQTHTAADNAQEQRWDEVQLSRAFLWYEARKRDGLLGGGQGASCTNCMRALDEVGCPVESDWPYYPSGYETVPQGRKGQAMFRHLERKPIEGVYKPASINQLTGVVDCTLGDQARRLILNGHPLHIGTAWPREWDAAIGRDGRAVGAGRSVGGHALCVDSFVMPGVWDRFGWYGINNSHGPIYHILTPALAAPIVGYKPAMPEKDYRYWVREDWLGDMMSRQGELIAPAGMTGFQVRPKLLEWGGLLS